MVGRCGARRTDGQHVIAVTAVQIVTAQATSERVVATEAAQGVVHHGATDQIVAGSSGDHQRDGAHRTGGQNRRVGELQRLDPQTAAGEPVLHRDPVGTIAMLQPQIGCVAGDGDIGAADASAKHQFVGLADKRCQFVQGVLAVAQGKSVDVTITAAAQRVVSAATNKDVAARCRVGTEQVLPGPAKQGVTDRQRVGKQAVIALAAVQRVVSGTTANQIVASQTGQVFVQDRALHHVVA